METFHFYVIFNLFVTISHAEFKVYTDDDVYITNTTSTFSNIPSDCDLFGADFRKDYPVNSTYLNITDIRLFWIGANVGFKRNINPIGMKTLCEETGDITLDKCNTRCRGYKFFSFGDKSCTCETESKTDEGLSKVEPCVSQDQGLCYGRKCTVYERDVSGDQYICDTYRYLKSLHIWIFNAEKCSEKKNYSYICSQGKSLDGNSSLLTWQEAAHKCKENGYNLINTTNGIGSKYKNKQTYWVSFFRRQRFIWGKGTNSIICVAAKIEGDGKLSLASKYCTEQLPVLCYKSNFHRDHRAASSANDSSDMTGVIVGVCVGIMVVIIAVVVVIIVKRRRFRKFPVLEIGKHQQKSESLDDVQTTLYESTSKTAGAYGFSLAVAYSEPLHLAPNTSKHLPEAEYDQVTYNPSVSETENKLCNITENPYGNPYS